MLKIINTRDQCGMTGFESPATEYKEMGLNLCLFRRRRFHDWRWCFSGDLLNISEAVEVKDGDIIVANLNGGLCLQEN